MSIYLPILESSDRRQRIRNKSLPKAVGWTAMMFGGLVFLLFGLYAALRPMASADWIIFAVIAAGQIVISLEYDWIRFPRIFRIFGTLTFVWWMLVMVAPATLFDWLGIVAILAGMYVVIVAHRGYELARDDPNAARSWAITMNRFLEARYRGWRVASLIYYVALAAFCIYTALCILRDTV